jgi:hypothetical protein
MPSTNKDTSTAVAISDANPNLQIDYVVPFNRQYYKVNKEKVEKGGVVVSGVKEALKITAKEYASFVSSTSDSRWLPYLSPKNILTLQGAEGVYPYAVYEIDNHENSKYICNPIPPEVGQKVFPKLHAAVTKDPKTYDLPIQGEGVSESKAAKNQAKIDALKWTPSDCQSNSNKSGTMKPCRINPQANKWDHTSLEVKKVLDEMFKVMVPKDKPTGTKRKAVDKEGPDANAVPDGVTFQTKGLLPGILMQGKIELLGGVPKFEVVGDACYMHVYQTVKQEPEEEAVAEEAGDEGGDGDDDA